MNYRHIFHAGNFADVFKHVIVARIVDYLKAKDKPFRVIDTHAGPGLYDLSSVEAQKTGEWRGGIGRLLDADLSPGASDFLAPYMETVRAFNPAGGLRFYPGSPAIIRHLLRARDRLTAIEKHPEEAFALKTRFDGDFQVRVIELDGWLSPGAHLPPKERRGLVLIDPPFEQEGEFERLVEGLATAHRRWPGGIYALWYPVKHPAAVSDFKNALKRSGIADMIDISLTIRARTSEPRLDGCGMIVVNPPFTLEDQLGTGLPALSALLSQGIGNDWAVERLAAETVSS